MAGVSTTNLQRLKYLWYLRTCNLKYSYSTLVYSTGYCMVNKYIRSRDIYLEFNNGCTTWWNQCGLDILCRLRAYSTLLIYRIKYLTYYMKCRCKIWSANTYIQTNCLAYICLKISRCCHWIKLHIGRLFGPHLFHIKRLCTLLTCLSFCIEISLNY